jgi:undecaprenyl diphosphate synthase
MKKINIQISGRVQGVGFRVSVKDFADKVGLVGFAENLKNGDVKVVAQGETEKVFELLKFCTNGSILSKPENITFKISDNLDNFSEFTVVRDERSLLHDQINAFQNLAKNLLPFNTQTLPKHVVIIPDGNRRWAREKNLPTFNGHKVGIVDKFKEIINHFTSNQIEVLTLWCLSTENWNREKAEIDYLMKLFIETMDSFESNFLEKNIIFKHLGRRSKLPKDVLEKIDYLTEKTKNNSGKTLCLALDYGGRDEIVRAVNNIIKSNKENQTEVTEESFSEFLDTKKLPDPDYIIRTSGEQRLSGILPWQGVYAELFFTPIKFPDFGEKEFAESLLEFSNRKRRFGK